jgi:hypothetical protein
MPAAVAGTTFYFMVLEDADAHMDNSVILTYMVLNINLHCSEHIQ